MGIRSFIRNQGHYFWVLLIGLAITCFFTLVGISASQAMMLVSNQDLGNYWRTTYDILVRPANSRLPVEQKHNFLASNYLAQISTAGGISYSQYQTIKSIPDIQVSAPVGLLTYINASTDALTTPFSAKEGLYLYEYIVTTDNGIQGEQEGSTDYDYVMSAGQHYSAYYYFGPTSHATNYQNIQVNQPIYLSPAGFSLLLAAVDPDQEAMLTHLDQTITRGEYLTGEEKVYTNTLSSPFGEQTLINQVPVLINAIPYVSFSETNRISRVLLPSNSTTLEEIITRGGVNYLKSLPTETISEQNVNSKDEYPKLINSLFKSSIGMNYGLENDQRSKIRQYAEIIPPFPYEGLALEVSPPSLSGASSTLDEIAFNIKPYGVFDIARIPPPPDINRVPMEIYHLPIVVMQYDESGQPVASRTIQPVYLSSNSYVQSPPLLLTTLEAAKAITGDGCAKCIGAIRVRVALEGCSGDYLTCPMSQQNQRKIETIATEIARRTGLEVDIMVGSSPTLVLVHVPGIGYVEEQWIQKNITTLYENRVQSGNWLIVGTLLIIGGFFTLDTTLVGMESKRRVIAIQKAFGWTNLVVFLRLIGEILFSSILAASIGTFAAWGVSQSLIIQTLTIGLFVVIPIVLILISSLGGMYPAWLYTQVPPMVMLREVGIKQRNRKKGISVSGIWTYAGEGLLRNLSRTILNIFNTAAAIGLLTLFIDVVHGQQGSLSGTLLGEFILVQIKGYHLAIAGVALLLAGISMMNNLVAGVTVRRREIGVLKAIGWQDHTVARIFLNEGVLIGLLGGIIGAIGGSVIFAALYRLISFNLLWVSMAGVVLALIIGCLGGIYPALLATKVPPAEAMRYE